MSHDFETSQVREAPPVESVVLAAGLSTRMGLFKLTMPWNDTTVIGRVVETLAKAGLRDIVLVTGHRADEVKAALAECGVRSIYNPDYQTGEMLTSVQMGLRALREQTMAALICLGDQPHVEVQTVLAILEAGRAERWQWIIVPSFERHAGHPILLPRRIWPTVWGASGTLRDALDAHQGDIRYLDVGTATVLADLDTPGDYHPNR